MNDPVMLRRYVRSVLGLAKNRHFSERMIFDSVARLTRDALTVDELKAALAWNEAKGFIESEKDEESAMPGEIAPLLWKLTDAGRAREGLA